jgi:hypothetical protein
MKYDSAEKHIHIMNKAFSILTQLFIFVWMTGAEARALDLVVGQIYTNVIPDSRTDLHHIQAVAGGKYFVSIVGLDQESRPSAELRNPLSEIVDRSSDSAVIRMEGETRYTGRYTLAIHNESRTAPARFRIQAVFIPVLATNTIEALNLVEERVVYLLPGEMKIYKVVGTDPRSVFQSLVGSGGLEAPRIAMIAEDGQLVVADRTGQSAVRVETEKPSSTTFFSIVQSGWFSRGSQGSALFRHASIPGPSAGNGKVLRPGEVLEGVIAPGGHDHHILEVPPYSTFLVRLSRQNSSQSLDLSVFDSYGDRVGGDATSFGSAAAIEVMRPPNGRYTVRVAHSWENDVEARYRLQVQVLSTQQSYLQHLSSNATTQAVVEAGSIWLASAYFNAGHEYTVDAGRVSGSVMPSISIYSPSGEHVSGATSFSDRTSLSFYPATDGLYFIALEDAWQSESGAIAVTMRGPASIGFQVIQQPISQVVKLGSSVRLCAIVAPDVNVQYQWYHNDRPVPEGTASCVEHKHVEFEHAGSYRLRIRNGGRELWTESVTLSVVRVVDELVKPAFTNCPIKWDGQSTNLVVLTHGVVPHFTSTDWLNELADSIRKVQVSPSQVEVIRWDSPKWPRLSEESFDEIIERGARVGECLSSAGWRHYHLIANSAGAAFVHGISLGVRSRQTNASIHCTFLDPFYSPRLSEATFGSAATWSDNYFSNEPIWQFAGMTGGRMLFAHNVDVGGLDSTPDLMFGLGDHTWPREFYLKTINQSTFGGGRYGWSRSRGGGGWWNRLDYPVNNLPVRVGGTSAAAIMAWEQLNPPLPVALLRPFDPLVGAAFPSLSSLRLRLAEARAREVGRIAGPHSFVATDSSASIIVGIKARSNFFRFRLKRIQGSDPDAILVVLWNGNPVGTIWPSRVGNGETFFRFPIPEGKIGLEQVVQFALAGDLPMEIDLSGVSLGFTAEPFLVPLSLTSVVKDNRSFRVSFTGKGDDYFFQEWSPDTGLWSTLGIFNRLEGLKEVDVSVRTETQAGLYRCLAVPYR